MRAADATKARLSQLPVPPEKGLREFNAKRIEARASVAVFAAGEGRARDEVELQRRSPGVAWSVLAGAAALVLAKTDRAVANGDADLDAPISTGGRGGYPCKPRRNTASRARGRRRGWIRPGRRRPHAAGEPLRPPRRQSVRAVLEIRGARDRRVVASRGPDRAARAAADPRGLAAPAPDHPAHALQRLALRQRPQSAPPGPLRSTAR